MQTWHEYYRDQNKAEVLIGYSFRLPSRVADFNIDDHPIYIRQQDGEIHVTFCKKVSQALLNDIREFSASFLRKEGRVSSELIQKNPSHFIVGYISDTLPRINEEILERKYKEGHVLMRTISQFDIYSVFVLDDKKETHTIFWPLVMPNFPEVNKFMGRLDVVFVRDLMDAMTEYFYFNFDGCVRKVITSLENYFTYYNLKASAKRSFWSKLFGVKKSKFQKLVGEYITEKFYGWKDRDLKIIRENILFVYEIRNLLVHDKLRLRLGNLMFCKKAIGTLLYIYQSKFVYKDGKQEYIFAFDMQFKALVNIIIGLNLDRFEMVERSKKQPRLIRTNDELNRSMFASLSITRKEKRIVKS